MIGVNVSLIQNCVWVIHITILIFPPICITWPLKKSSNHLKNTALRWLLSSVWTGKQKYFWGRLKDKKWDCNLWFNYWCPFHIIAIWAWMSIVELKKSKFEIKFRNWNKTKISKFDFEFQHCPMRWKLNVQEFSTANEKSWSVIRF